MKPKLRSPSPAPGAKPPPTNHRGFTLVEFVLAAGLSAVLLLGIGSAFVISARALPANAAGLSAADSATSTIERITTELAYATQVLQIQPGKIEFIVPDQDNDSLPETIAYALENSNTLTRTLNGKATTTILNNVDTFALSAGTVFVPAPAPPPAPTDRLLFGCDGGTPVLLALTGVRQVSQIFRPTLAAGEQSWRVTRALIKLAQSGPVDGVTIVDLRGSTSTTPFSVAGTPINIAESSLSATAGWVEVNFGSTLWVSASTDLAIVIRRSSGTASAAVVEASNVQLSTASFAANNGSGWAQNTTSEIAIQIFGHVSAQTALAANAGSIFGTPGQEEPDAPDGETLLTRVEITLKTRQSATLRSTAVLVNQPEAP